MNTTKLIWNKSFIRSDIAYIRIQLRNAETAIKNGDWKEAEEIFQEIGAIGATQESCCRDNLHGVQNADYELAYTGLLS